MKTQNLILQTQIYALQVAHGLLPFIYYDFAVKFNMREMVVSVVNLQYVSILKY